MRAHKKPGVLIPSAPVCALGQLPLISKGSLRPCRKFSEVPGGLPHWGTQWCIECRPAGHASSAATRRPTVNKFVEFCFQFCYWLFKTTKYSKGKKGCGSREPPPFELRRILFSTSLLSKPQAKTPDGSPIGGFSASSAELCGAALTFRPPVV